jgi:hypothetical protein
MMDRKPLEIQALDASSWVLSALVERRGRDSNPRDPCGPYGFQDRPHDSVNSLPTKGLRQAPSPVVAQGKRAAQKTPSDLAAIIDAWPTLPEAIKAGILAMVRASGRDRGESIAR